MNFTQLRFQDSGRTSEYTNPVKWSASQTFEHLHIRVIVYEVFNTTQMEII